MYFRPSVSSSLRAILTVLFVLSFIHPVQANTYSDHDEAYFWWGQIGHRTTGWIAQELLSPEAQAAVNRVLEGNSLAEVSTWMDEVRSDRSFDYMGPWHYVTIPPGQTYQTAEKPAGGDVLWALDKVVRELSDGGLTPEQEAINLKVLVHLIGDLHQPLHVGNGTDRGGNDVRLEWFGDRSNLHRVWDSEMIDSKQLSFIELADFIDDGLNSELINQWQSTHWYDWAMESQDMLSQVYDLPENGRLGYEYMFKNFEAVQLRLLQAGVRLAGVINQIYTPS